MVPGTRSRSAFTLVAILVTVAALSSDTHPVTARAAVSATAAAVAETGTLVLSPQDTSLNINATNSSTDTVLTTYTLPDYQVANAVVMKFDLSPLPAGAVITGATLHLALIDSDNSANATYTVSAHKVIGKNPVISQATGYTADGHTNWTATACCYNGVPLAQADISPAYDQQAIDKTPGFKSWSIVALVQEWLADPATNFGLLLNSDASTLRDRYRFFASMEHSDATLRPFLRITFAAADATLPSVTITAPLPGTVAGTLSVAATASDNVGVAGVQFQIDGVPLGTELTSAPFTLAWDTTTLSDGAHALVAVARDWAGNSSVSAAIGVTATNSITLLSPQDTSLNTNATNYSTDTILSTYTWPANKVANAAVMKFDLSALPAGAFVTDATLYLALVQHDGNADPTYIVSAHKVLGKNPVISTATGYTADGVTNWTPAACCPVPLAQADISAAYDQAAIDKTLGFKSWAVTTMVQEWLANPATNFGLLLNSDASKPADRYRFFASMEHTDANLRPYLKVTYSSTAAPTIALSATTVAAGATVTATIANGPGNASDWVGLVDANAADGTYVDWKYLNGTRTRPGAGMTGAAVPFTMPATPGTYNVRFFLNDSWVKLATSATITVTPPAPPAITLSATTIAPGGTVTATIANGPGNAGDWVGLLGASAADGTYVDWKYLNGMQTRPGAGVTGAAVAFVMPATPGTYNVRFFLNDSWVKLATSATITVTAPAPPTITLSATTIAPGATVTATIANGPGNAGDWVGLLSASAADGTYMDWKYLSGTRIRPGAGVTGAAVPFTMPATPGTYNVRLFLNDSWVKLATSLTITVQTADGTSPLVSITGPAAGATVSSVVTVTANASDNVGVVGVQFKLDGANLGAEDPRRRIRSRGRRPRRPMARIR